MNGMIVYHFISTSTFCFIFWGVAEGGLRCFRHLLWKHYHHIFSDTVLGLMSCQHRISHNKNNKNNSAHAVLKNKVWWEFPCIWLMVEYMFIECFLWWSSKRGIWEVHNVVLEIKRKRKCEVEGSKCLLLSPEEQEWFTGWQPWYGITTRLPRGKLHITVNTNVPSRKLSLSQKLSHLTHHTAEVPGLDFCWLLF